MGVDSRNHLFAHGLYPGWVWGAHIHLGLGLLDFVVLVLKLLSLVRLPLDRFPPENQFST